ncbi:MAG: ATP-binding cassette domain-containing protein [Buchnera aphidicola (Schlechtendalia chinensis)]
MPLICMQNARFSINKNKLLNNVNFQINKKERICLIGRNGTGKSTFLDIITKKELLDHGLIIHKKNIKIEYLKQTMIEDHEKSVYEFIHEGLEQDSEHLKNYFYELNNEKLKKSSHNLKLLTQLKEKSNRNELWKEKEKIENIIKTFGLNSNLKLSSLSGGCLRKVELGRILIRKPDLIILDEPTNHLDIIAIDWLGKFLVNNSQSVLFVSHDRSFINKVSTRIINLNSGCLISWSGDYNSFLNFQNTNKNLIKIQNLKFNKKLEKEKLWVQSGVKARSTKNENRITRFKKMLTMGKINKISEKKIDILINEENYKGDIFLKLKNIHFYKNKTILINNFSDVIKKGEKIALIGSNGSGKSTLLKLIVRTLQPKIGNIYSNPNTKISYFDQKRVLINLEKTVLDNLSYESEEVVVNDKKYYKFKYLEKFLFSKDRLRLKAKELSGGEINKLLLAKVFLKKSNILILDEPTNDLDLESLKNLEISLKKYQGVILIVSHDKTFIKNIANKYWNFEKNGIIKKYLNFPNINSTKNIQKSFEKNVTLKTNYNLSKIKNNLKNKTLNYNLKKELKNIPKKIEQIEIRIKKLQNKINTSFFFHKPLSEQKNFLTQLKMEEKDLQKHFSRWEYLETHNDKNICE